MKKLALVTGGGRGLGAAICRELAEAGHEVLAADRSFPVSGPAKPMQLDLANDSEIAKAIGGLDRLDVLVNNAGVDFTLPIEELSLAQWDSVMDVNLRAPFLLAKHASRLMKAQGGGHIVNIASTAAKRAWPNASAYHASKWGLLGLSHALHAELRPHRIKVSAVVAGGMRTPFLLERFPDIDPGVLQDPANVAKTVRFLLTLPDETVIPEVMVIPMRESSWP
ncbi:MAG TPA: SDR family oxidoreductase [Burkholderiales bacterium]|nr:SDR family oxidoreductase [Burkholderiales bacterium]